MINIIFGMLTEIGLTFLQIAPYLLIGLMFAGVLHILISKEQIAKHLGNNDFSSVVKAAVLGVPLPLCSCGVVPTALHLRKQKASEGATLSFLISTPQTGIDSIIPTYGMLGPVFAIFRPIFALITGVVGGVFANRFLEKSRDEEVPVINCVGCDETPVAKLTSLGKIKKIFTYAFGDFIDDIGGHLLVGIALAGIISYLVPDRFFSQYGGEGVLGMIMMALLGIPLYVCATSSIPIAASLILKGISPGAAFVFLVAGPATNAATITLITRVMGKKAAVLYLSVIGGSALLGGWLLNSIFDVFSGTPISEHVHSRNQISLFTVVSGGLLALVLLISFIRKGRNRMEKEDPVQEQGKTYAIEGMTCRHCASHVQKALLGLDGVRHVQVNLEKKEAFVSGRCSREQVVKAVEEAGYEVVAP